MILTIYRDDPECTHLLTLLENHSRSFGGMIEVTVEYARTQRSVTVASGSSYAHLTCHDREKLQGRKCLKKRCGRQHGVMSSPHKMGVSKGMVEKGRQGYTYEIALPHDDNDV